MTQPRRAARMEHILRAGFSPVRLEIEDQSARHAGHSGASPEGETHFHVRLQSAAFDGLSRVARSRLVHSALAPEFASGLHALSLNLISSNETKT